MMHKPTPTIFLRLAIAAVFTSMSPVCASAGEGDVPSYPGAHAERITGGARAVTSACGHTFSIQKSLTVDADPHAIAKWYEAKMPGSRLIELKEDADASDNGGSMVSFELITADGARTVVVSRMHFNNPKLASMSKTIGLDKAQIGLESVSPPFSAAYAALVAQAAEGGRSAATAKTQLKAMCNG